MVVTGSPLLEASAPMWATRFAMRLTAFFQPLVPNSPSLLAAFDSAALPDPAAWRLGMIYVTDKACVGVSTGAAWVRADGSAL
jgi:hypothetical protein